MHDLFAKSLMTNFTLESVMSVVSLGLTSYFWLVRARREQPSLEVHQIQEFRAVVRSDPSQRDAKRLCISQVSPGGVLVANNSTRQNSVLRFDCFVETPDGWVSGSWGYLDDDKPPWNIGPESTIAISPACFFPVPDGFEVPESLRFRIELITVSGRRFGADLSLAAPI